MKEEISSSQPQDSQNKTPISRSRSKDVKPFKRNPNLSYAVHALLHLSQFLTVLAIEAFHHIHHLINETLREEDSKISRLRDERHPIFVVIPICMIMNLFLGVMWVVATGFWKRIELGLIGCAFGAILMLLCAIFSMRHAQMYINIEAVSDEDLLRHPIFIHSFTECILAIFALASYLLHFWFYYECLRWQLREQEWRNETSILPNDTFRTTPSKSTESPDILTSPEQTLHEKNVEDEPVILYCFCIDCWNYIQHRYNTQNDVDQSEVVTVA